MPPVTITAADFEYIGKSSFPSSVPAQFPQGIGLRQVGSQLKLYTYLFNTKFVWEYDVPSSFDGPLTAPRNAGAPSMASLSTDFMYGLHWDYLENRMYYSYNSQYPAVATRQTLNSGKFDPVTNKLVTYSANGTFGTEYKRYFGGMVDIPDWFSAAYTGGKRLGVGFGGSPEASVGGSSMGPSLCAIDPTPAGGAMFTIPKVNLIGFPYAAGGPTPTVALRPTNYMQEPPGSIGTFDPRFPYDPTILGVGYVSWPDRINGCGAWVEDKGKSGLVCVYNLGTGCEWYGHNDGSPNPCSNQIGTKAALNTIGMGQYWYITSPTDMAAVAGGAPQYSFQPTYTQLNIPGLPNPTQPGLPSGKNEALAIKWCPINKVLGILSRNTFGTTFPTVFWYRVAGGITPPPPDPIPQPTIYYPLNGATGVMP